MVEISRLQPADREAWEVLARGYKEFYKTPEPDEAYAAAWVRLLADDVVHGFAARLDGTVVGIVHYLFHASTWDAGSCYLQDLFVSSEARGHGVARALIEAVAEATRDEGVPRLYWCTHESNATARALYDKVANNEGFVIYDYPLTTAAP